MRPLLILACLAALAAPGRVQAADPPLPKLGARTTDLTVSGISSGAAMAVQYAVAHSAEVAGIGVVAGPPFYCSRGSLERAVKSCMCASPAPDPDTLLSDIRDMREVPGRFGDADMLIDDPRNLLRQKVYVFQSQADSTLYPAVGDSTIAQFDALKQGGGDSTAPARCDNGKGIAVGSRNAPAEPVRCNTASTVAAHGLISPDAQDHACGIKGGDYIQSCIENGKPIDLAADMFNLFYGSGAVRGTQDVPNRLRGFDQREFTRSAKTSNPRADLAESGYVYVPAGCETGGDRIGTCRVHVAFHGCKMTGAAYPTLAGYNEWAETYGVIVLYPQIRKRPNLGESNLCGQFLSVPPTVTPISLPVMDSNPNGCWDWWGHNGERQKIGGQSFGLFATKQGAQMKAVEAMVRRLSEK